MWTWLRQVVKSFFTKYPPVELTRRELLCQITISCGVSFLFFGMDFLTLFITPDHEIPPDPVLGWFIIITAVFFGLFICWAICRTPVEKQSISLRFFSIVSTLVAATSFALMGYLEMVNPLTIRNYFSRQMAAIIELIILIAVLSLIKKTKTEIKNNRIKPLDWDSIDTKNTIATSIYGSFGLFFFVFWCFDLPDYFFPKWFSCIILILSPFLFFINILLLRIRKKHTGKLKIHFTIISTVMLIFITSISLFSSLSFFPWLSPGYTNYLKIMEIKNNIKYLENKIEKTRADYVNNILPKLLNVIDCYKKINGRLPNSWKETGINEDVCKDPWGHDFQLVIHSITSCEYTIICAGPDGIFGTADDICSPKNSGALKIGDVPAQHPAQK